MFFLIDKCSSEKGKRLWPRRLPLWKGNDFSVSVPSNVAKLRRKDLLAAYATSDLNIETIPQEHTRYLRHSGKDALKAFCEYFKVRRRWESPLWHRIDVVIMSRFRRSISNNLYTPPFCNKALFRWPYLCDITVPIDGVFSRLNHAEIFLLRTSEYVFVITPNCMQCVWFQKQIFIGKASHQCSLLCKGPSPWWNQRLHCFRFPQSDPYRCTSDGPPERARLQ